MATKPARFVAFCDLLVNGTSTPEQQDHFARALVGYANKAEYDAATPAQRASAAWDRIKGNAVRLIENYDAEELANTPKAPVLEDQV